MPLPNKIKKTIPLTFPKTLYPRREQLLEKINKDGTYLPKSILHADLDGGMLNFVQNELQTIVDGQVIPMVDIIITSQNWSQFTETWNFQDLDSNVSPPFITVVRNPEVKFGTNPATIYNIPNRKQYFYAQVPTWDGNRNGMDIYKIPQPVPVDITYSVKIICNRMRELNALNKNILEMFASRQAYTTIKGHYIPIIMNNITDESVMNIDKRKYYIQSYDFTMLGFLIDENEFEVAPAVSRVLTVIEFEKESFTRGRRKNIADESTVTNFLFVTGNNILSQIFDYTVDLNLGDTTNIDSYDVYLNNQYYGSDLLQIQINTNDVLKIIVVKNDDSKEGIIQLNNEIL
jgi:hypothetical protein